MDSVSSRWLSPVVQAFLALLLSVTSNALLFGLNLDQYFDVIQQPSFAPEGWVIGTVWFFLFAMHGYAKGLIDQSNSPMATLASRSLLVLIVSNACYGFYVPPLLETTRIPGLLGNLLCLGLGAFSLGASWSVSRTAALLILPMILWISFATVIVGGQIALNGL